MAFAAPPDGDDNRIAGTERPAAMLPPRGHRERSGLAEWQRPLRGGKSCRGEMSMHSPGFGGRQPRGGMELEPAWESPVSAASASSPPGCGRRRKGQVVLRKRSSPTSLPSIPSKSPRHVVVPWRTCVGVPAATVMVRALSANGNAAMCLLSVDSLARVLVRGRER